MPQPPLTTDWREWSRFMAKQTQNLDSLTSSVNFGPQRELIPQLGPIRRTDAITGYQAIGQNEAVYVPFLINADYWDVNGFYWVHDTFGTGHVCVGIYDETAKLLLSTGSLDTANEMSVAISPAVRVPRGRYYLGFAMDNATDTFTAFEGTPFGNDLIRVKASGVRAQGLAFPLPAQATFAAPGWAFIPAVYVGIAAPS